MTLAQHPLRPRGPAPRHVLTPGERRSRCREPSRGKVAPAEPREQASFMIHLV